MQVSKAVEIIERFYGLTSLNDPAVGAAWQTLKTAVKENGSSVQLLRTIKQSVDVKKSALILKDSAIYKEINAVLAQHG